MTDWIGNETRNRFTVPERISRFHRKLNPSWALSGKDALLLFACGVAAGMLIGAGLITAGWL